MLALARTRPGPSRRWPLRGHTHCAPGAAVLILILACRVCPAQAPEIRGRAVELAAALDGTLTCEVKAAPGTWVGVAASARLSADGTRLGDDGDALIVTLSEPLLRGMTNQDGVFRTRIPVDPRLRDRMPAVLHAQAARLLPDGSWTDSSNVVSLKVEPASHLAAGAWAAVLLAALVSLAFLPARVRAAGARVIAGVALVAAPLLLGRAFAPELLSAPALPGGAPHPAALGSLAVLALALRTLPARSGWVPAIPFSTLMALVGLAIVCVPAWFRTGGPRDPGIAYTASILVVLGALGATPAARAAAVLAQAAILFAYPLVSQSWSGLADVGIAAVLLCGFGLALRGRWIELVLLCAVVAFLALRAWPGAVASDWALATGWPDLRRAPTLAWLVADSCRLVALALPGLAAVLAAALVARGTAGGADRRLAALACSAAVLMLAQLVAVLGTSGYLPMVVAASFDRVLVQTLPLALGVLVAVAAAGARGSVHHVGDGRAGSAAAA